MINNQNVVDFIAEHNYDIRVSNNGRWIDQKCAADVVTVIADCIVNYVDNNGDVDYFRSMNIWHSEYAATNVENIFKKPNVESSRARSEYDKFFQQPMELLTYSGVLEKMPNSRYNYYKVANRDMLEYIALREKNALFFLQTYIRKVLEDSGIYYLFEHFFEFQTSEEYKKLKEGYSSFIIENTNINTDVECNRIFIKVLNPLAYKYNKRGTERGDISAHPITYDMLMYNRNNFRDLFMDKPKGVTRAEYLETHDIEVANTAYYHYQSQKAKAYLHKFNKQFRDGQTEHLEDNQMDDVATNIHHIFPESKFPEISFYLENLIALTPTQHINYAHHLAHTAEIDEQYQHLLLLSKTERIRENLSNLSAEHIYSFNNLKYVLYVGFDDDEAMEIVEMDYDSIYNFINVHYA